MNCLDDSRDTKGRGGDGFARIGDVDDLKLISAGMGIQVALKLAWIFFAVRFVQAESFGSTDTDDTDRAIAQFGAAVAQTIQLPFLVSRAGPAALSNLV